MQLHTNALSFRICRDLRYISIRQYIDAVIEYRIVILCSMNIEVLKWLCSAE